MFNVKEINKLQVDSDKQPTDTHKTWKTPFIIVR